MNANLAVCIPVMIAHVLIASTPMEATAVCANLATKVMDGCANYLVINLVDLDLLKCRYNYDIVRTSCSIR